MSPTGWHFAIYWRELAKDFGILVRTGRLQKRCELDGDDTPSAWFRRAATSYMQTDSLGKLARRTCLLVAEALAGEVPS